MRCEKSVVLSSNRVRVRYLINSMYRNHQIAQCVEEELQHTLGVIHASSSYLTAGVLVVYDPVSVGIDEIKKKILQSIRQKGRSQKFNNPSVLKSRKNKFFDEGEASETVDLSDWDRISQRGLTDQEVEVRAKTYGLNRLKEPDVKSEFHLFLNQFQNLPVSLLFGAASLSVLTGGVADSAVILFVIFANSYIAYRMESSAQKIIRALLRTDRSPLKVIRSGNEKEIDPQQVVPGDLFLLSPGVVVPADGKLVEVERMNIDESLLTGESLPVSKSRKNPFVFKGSVVTSGSARVIALKIGQNTQIGTIHQLMSTSEPPETPMQQQLNHLGDLAAKLAIGVSSLLFGYQLWKGLRWIDALKTSVSLAVASIPESLPTVATITLARGVKDLEKSNVWIRHLHALESLASAEIICFDKTGTLTLNQMEVNLISTFDGTFKVDRKKIYKEGHIVDSLKFPVLRKVIEVSVLCNEARISNSSHQQAGEGSSTEAALLRMATYSGMDILKLKEKFPVLSTQYRSEDQPYMITKHPQFYAIKGAPLEVLLLCKYFQRGQKSFELNELRRRQIIKENQSLAQQGFRVLGIAYGTQASHCTWVGLVSMTDILRQGIGDLVSQFQDAGIQTMMITGDQKLTAQAIGKEIGVHQIFARVNPSQKLKIIQRFQKAGKTVAMIGDGINDGPALKAADVGIAMAAKGSEAAAQAADIVLPSDNLDGLFLAIREGRTIHENMKKSIDYIASQNLSEILYVFLSIVLRGREPFSPIQFLLINLVTDLFPELALAQEASESDIMKKAPHYFNRKFISKKDSYRTIAEALILTSAPILNSNSVAFLTVMGSSLLFTLHSRSNRLTLFDRERPEKNRFMPLALGFGFFSEFIGLVQPNLKTLLGLDKINKWDVAKSSVGSVFPFLVLDFFKFISKRTA